MKTKRRLYLAYGSNLNKYQMEYRCPDAKPVGTTWISDHRLVFQGQPHNAHLNIIPEKGLSVPVAVWEISERDEAMLDRYEGVQGGYYQKEYMEVDLNGEKVRALVYIMCKRHQHLGLPDLFYMNTCRAGYKDFDFPGKILEKALIYSYTQERSLV